MKHDILVCLQTVILLTILFPILSGAQTRPVFPQHDGICLRYSHFGPDGAKDADFTLIIRNMTGNQENGTLDMVYKAYDEKGRPYFSDENEFVMSISRTSGQTYTTMDRMSKTVKIKDLIVSGDAGAICVPMTVGEELPDTQIFTSLGIFSVILTVTDKKVLDYKTVIFGGKKYDCWLVHEKTLTKTPVGTEITTSDTWYAEGVGCISQTVYNARGKLKSRLELQE